MTFSGLPAADIAAWVEESCAAQGVPSKVTDPAIVKQVAILLSVPVTKRARRG